MKTINIIKILGIIGLLFLLPSISNAQIQRVWNIAEYTSTMLPPPATGTKVAYRTLNNSLFYWDGTQWKRIAGPGIVDTSYSLSFSSPNLSLLGSGSSVSLTNLYTAGYGLIKTGETWRADTTSPNGLATRLFAKTLPTTIGTGQIAYSNGSNLVGTPNFIWDNPNRRIGMGTTPTIDIDIRTTTNTPVGIQMINSDGGNNSYSYLLFRASSTAGRLAVIGKMGDGVPPAQTRNAGDFYLYNGANFGDIVLHNDYPSGRIKFTGGASSTTHMMLNSNGYLNLGTSATPSYIFDINSTDAIRLPRGTDAQRPTNAFGLLRGNTTGNGIEFGSGTNWSYLLRSSLAGGVGTNTYVPYFGSDGYLTQNIGLRFDAAKLIIAVPGGVLINGAYSGTAASGVAILGTVTATNASESPIAIGANSSTSASRGIAIGLGAAAANGIAIGRETIAGNDQFVVGASGNTGNGMKITEVIFNTDNSTSGVGRAINIRNGNAFGTDQAGANINYIASKGTGAGTPGSHIFYTGAPLASGSTLQTSTERLRILATNGFIGAGGSPSYFLDLNSTDAIRLPRGTTAQAPTLANGIMRFNTNLDAVTIGRNSGATLDVFGMLGKTQTWTGTNTFQANGTNGAIYWQTANSNIATSMQLATRLNTPYAAGFQGLYYGNNAAVAFDVTNGGYLTMFASGQISMYAGLGSSGGQNIQLIGNLGQSASNNAWNNLLSSTFISNPVVTSGNVRNTRIAPTFNLAHTNTMVLTGLYYNPTISSFAPGAHYVLESEMGDVFLKSTAGPKILMYSNVNNSGSPEIQLGNSVSAATAAIVRGTPEGSFSRTHLDVLTNNTLRMRVQSGGGISGINMYVPFISRNGTITGATNNSGDRILSFNSGGDNINGNAAIVAVPEGSFSRVRGIGFAINNTGVSSWADATSSDFALYVNNDKKVGIQTTTPSEGLDVNEDLRVRDSTRLGVTPAHTAISGLLTKSATGWVGLSTFGNDLKYSSGILGLKRKSLIDSLPLASVTIDANANDLAINNLTNLDFNTEDGNGLIHMDDNTVNIESNVEITLATQGDALLTLTDEVYMSSPNADGINDFRINASGFHYSFTNSDALSDSAMTLFTNYDRGLLKLHKYGKDNHITTVTGEYSTRVAGITSNGLVQDYRLARDTFIEDVTLFSVGTLMYDCQELTIVSSMTALASTYQEIRFPDAADHLRGKKIIVYSKKRDGGTYVPYISVVGGVSRLYYTTNPAVGGTDPSSQATLYIDDGTWSDHGATYEFTCLKIDNTPSYRWVLKQR